MSARVPWLVGARACVVPLAARAQGDAVAQVSRPGPLPDAGFAPARFAASPDPIFEPQAFALFASNAGYGTGRHTAVTLSGHGPVISVAPRACAFVLREPFHLDTPLYVVAAAVETFPGNPF